MSFDSAELALDVLEEFAGFAGALDFAERKGFKFFRAASGIRTKRTPEEVKAANLKATKAYRSAVLLDGARRTAYLEKKRAKGREWYHASKARRAAALRAADARAYAKIKADPKKWAALLERRRMSGRKMRLAKGMKPRVFRSTKPSQREDP